METNKRPLFAIAADIRKEWKNVYFGARPYLQALSEMTTEDHYGHDSRESVILYFLANASGFRGAKARELKAELKMWAK